MVWKISILKEQGSRFIPTLRILQSRQILIWQYIPPVLIPQAFKDFSFGNYALGKSNNGFGADIGLIYRPLNNLEIGVSMLDLGSIKWR